MSACDAKQSHIHKLSTKNIQHHKLQYLGRGTCTRVLNVQKSCKVMHADFKIYWKFKGDSNTFLKAVSCILTLF